MLENRLALLQRRFAIAATAHHEALEAMDEKRANTQARNITALYQALLCEGADGQKSLLALVDSGSPVVAGMAAVSLLHLHTELCLATLNRVALEPGLIGFRASVAIERWKTGEWIPPGG